MEVHIIVINHRHGSDTLVAATKKEVFAELTEWVEQFWDAELRDPENGQDDLTFNEYVKKHGKEAAVEYYFSRMEGREHYDSFTNNVSLPCLDVLKELLQVTEMGDWDNLWEIRNRIREVVDKEEGRSLPLPVDS